MFINGAHYSRSPIDNAIKKFPGYQDINIRDAKDNDAEAMIFLCPMCLDALSYKCGEAGLKTYMISDLCRLALGETLG